MTLRPDAAMAAEYHDDKQQENEEQQTSDYSAGASNNGISEGSANEGTSGSLGNWSQQPLRIAYQFDDFILCIVFMFIIFYIPNNIRPSCSGNRGGGVQMRQNNVSPQSEVEIELVQVTELRRAGRLQIRLLRTTSNRRTSNGHGDLKPWRMTSGTLPGVQSGSIAVWIESLYYNGKVNEID